MPRRASRDSNHTGGSQAGAARVSCGANRSDVLWERANVVVQTLNTKSFETAMNNAQAALRENDMRRLVSIYQSALDVETRLLEEIDSALDDSTPLGARTDLAVDDQVAAKVASHGLWILARVVGIQSDDVEVEDVDDDNLRRFKVKRHDVLQLPREPSEIAVARATYKPPAMVFAMYPETTSFYKAEVVAPAHISVTGEDVCLVRFADDEDDEGNLPARPIPLRFIAELPPHI
ncbi:hypothetical protein CTAYLR_000504 [Chrysophaeum taylorii]|uniref:SGF29 C-terminal domain-containing protein n=1 Tax=Chrysophaeum taylorii TaxID=2483200 RepID=A0AAD7UGC0_9STRA|nr:hypothetical protein CTAYLR_000504 [Chrysophaeum taylorii]